MKRSWLPIAAGLSALALVAYLLMRSPSKPPMQFVSSRMYFPKRGSTKVKGIVIHITVTSSPKSTVAVLEDRGLSTDFEVDAKGQIFQYNPDLRNQFAQATGAGSNRHVVAIDLTYIPGNPWPEAQVAAARDLVQWLASEFSLPLALAPDKDRRDWSGWEGQGYTLFRHRNFVAKDCPSTFPMEALL